MTTEPPAAEPDAGNLLWASPAGPRRGPKPKYTLEAIADAAITIADREGLDSVTMQRVADELGTTKMALYRYVPGRTGLDAAMLDRALGTPDLSPAAEWREVLTHWTGSIHTRARTRPWIVELIQRPHTPGPVELTWFEIGLTSMTDLPLRGSEKLDLLALLVGHAMSLVRQSTRSAMPEEELATALSSILAVHADRYPMTAAAFAESAQDGSRDDALHFGVDRVLAGVNALIAERTRATSAPS